MLIRQDGAYNVVRDDNWLGKGNVFLWFSSWGCRFERNWKKPEERKREINKKSKKCDSSFTDESVSEISLSSYRAS